uniref:Uncharacterized protein n=1 Tax=Rangifer tarandus platyrhynchus TaxID=3082113 RepID=A0ACB0FK80_RANTA|nr:unnamed protein product [Rangifer tarandus platyrhynchus]
MVPWESRPGSGITTGPGQQQVTSRDVALLELGKGVWRALQWAAAGVWTTELQKHQASLTRPREQPASTQMHSGRFAVFMIPSTTSPPFAITILGNKSLPAWKHQALGTGKVGADGPRECPDRKDPEWQLEMGQGHPTAPQEAPSTGPTCGIAHREFQASP